MKTPIVTFDFDNTLSRPDVQEYAKKLIDKGVDVWVLTSRYDELHKHLYSHNPTNEDLYDVTDKLGIPRCKIRFTCMVSKDEYLYRTNVLFHLDDDDVERILINSNTDTICISVLDTNYKQQCEEVLRSQK